LNPIINLRLDKMRSTYKLERRYRVMTLTRKDWTKGTETPPIVTGHVRFTDGFQMRGGWTGVYGQPERRISLPLGRYGTAFRPIYLPFWPVFITLKITDQQRNA
jgi:hypothetical protein